MNNPTPSFSDQLTTPSGLDLYYRGPDLNQGQMPALFYFAISGTDSLHLDPFNQPVAFLDSLPIRCYSFDIPGHGPGLDNTKGMIYWAEKIARGEDILSPFFDQVLQTIDYLIEQNYVNPSAMGVAGLSRGAFIATHIAARDARIKTLLGFAPLTRLAYTETFAPYAQSPTLQSLELSHLMKPLSQKSIRYYIGNRDVRVGTDCCFEWLMQLTEYAYTHGVRSPQFDLIISPSVGHKGHGTLPHTFRAGSDWIYNQLLLNKA